MAGGQGPVINSVSVLSSVEFADVSFRNNVYRCPVGEYGNLLHGAVGI